MFELRCSYFVIPPDSYRDHNWNFVIKTVEDIREAFANGIRTKYILQKSLTVGGNVKMKIDFEIKEIKRKR